MDVLWQAGGLALVSLLAEGPILGVLLLLNRRDRRREALLGTLWEVTPWDLRSRIVIQARAAVLSSRTRVTVYMPDCSHEEMWEALRRYCPRLPPRTRLLVEGAVDRGASAVLRVETACPPPPREPRLFLSWG